MSRKIDSVLLEIVVDELGPSQAGEVISRVSMIVADMEAAQADNARLRHDLATVDTQLQITSQDRDARRRRMELAQWILDYEQQIDIEMLWDVLCGRRVAIFKEAYEHLTAMEHAIQSAPRTFGVMNPNGPQVPESVDWAEPLKQTVYPPDVTQQPTILSTDDSPKQPVDGGQCESSNNGMTCRFEDGHHGMHSDVVGNAW